MDCFDAVKGPHISLKGGVYPVTCDDQGGLEFRKCWDHLSPNIDGFIYLACP